MLLEITTKTGLLAGLSVLDQLLIGLIIIILVAGFGSLINLSFQLMKLQQLRFLKENNPEAFAAQMKEPVRTNWLKWAYDKLTDDVPIAKEADIMLDHDYDGIHELDNNLPPWWKGVMYISMVFAPIYLYVHHFSDYAKSSQEHYEIAMQEAEEEVAAFLATQQNAVDETNVELLADADALGKGAVVYAAKCAVCHGQLGEGGIGPNLTDRYWLHGGDISAVFRTIKYGVPEKGMIAWKSEMRPRDMQEVASYILSLEGTNPPNAKEPQGQPLAAGK
ncbi:MAG: cbb3-type cytochrome c oxidase N-terminal domain-containing protein [Bacteroidota bacterium]